MDKLTITFKDLILKVHASDSCITIYDSFRIKSIKDMKYILLSIKDSIKDNLVVKERSVASMLYEWRVHNLLYSLGVMKDRTGSVDLNTGQPWYIKVLYFIISPFYFHFY